SRRLAPRSGYGSIQYSPAATRSHHAQRTSSPGLGARSALTNALKLRRPPVRSRRLRDSLLSAAQKLPVNLLHPRLRPLGLPPPRPPSAPLAPRPSSPATAAIARAPPPVTAQELRGWPRAETGPRRASPPDPASPAPPQSAGAGLETSTRPEVAPQWASYRGACSTVLE